MTSATMILNQIQFLHKLRDAGFTEKQAETLTEAISNDVAAGLATKHDVALLKKDVDSVKQELRQEMQNIEHRMYVRILGGMALLLAVMPAFMKYFSSFLGN